MEFVFSVQFQLDVAELWVKVGHGGPGVHQISKCHGHLFHAGSCANQLPLYGQAPAASWRTDGLMFSVGKCVTNGKFEETTFFFSSTLPRVHQGTNEGGRHPPAPGDGVGSDETHMEQHNGAGSHENTVKVRQTHPLRNDLLSWRRHPEKGLPD